MRRFLPLLFALLLPGCAGLLNATVPTTGLRIDHDVRYGDAPRQALDVYRPADAAKPLPSGKAKPLPVVVFLYGGSWRTGNKGIYLFAAAAMARRGAVVVVPDYRLFPAVRYPAFLDDCARAVAWAQHHAAEWGGDAGRVVVMGHSAGAYNAAMLATAPEYLRAAGGSRDALAGFVGLAGPYDFLPITDPDIVPIFPPNDPDTMPINHADAHVPPTLLLAGTADQTVEPRNSQALAARIQAAGGQATVKLYPSTGHIGLILDLTPPFRGRAPVLDDVVGFVTGVPARPPAAAEPPSPASTAG